MGALSGFTGKSTSRLNGPKPALACHCANKDVLRFAAVRKLALVNSALRDVRDRTDALGHD